ncbi:Nucleoplasmin-like domain, partial [Dillenia turbinata]
MEFWDLIFIAVPGVEVKAGETFKVELEAGRFLHLSQATLGESKKEKGNESIPIFLKFNDQKLVLGTLSPMNFPQISYDLVFEKGFELSHNWKNGSVYFCGYTSFMDDDEYPRNFFSTTFSMGAYLQLSALWLGLLNCGLNECCILWCLDLSFITVDDFSEDSDEDVPLNKAENGKPVPKKETKTGAKKPEAAVKLAEKPGEQKKGESSETSSDDVDDEMNESEDGSSEEDSQGMSVDEDDSDGGDSDDEDDSEDEETPTPKKKPEVVKKRASDSAAQTPVNKKAKAASPQVT